MEPLYTPSPRPLETLLRDQIPFPNIKVSFWTGLPACRVTLAGVGHLACFLICEMGVTRTKRGLHAQSLTFGRSSKVPLSCPVASHGPISQDR